MTRLLFDCGRMPCAKFEDNIVPYGRSILENTISFVNLEKK